MEGKGGASYISWFFKRGSSILLRGHDQWYVVACTSLQSLHSYCPFTQNDLSKYLEAADAKKEYPELYTRWREDPSNFKVNGIYPVRKLWGTAREAWKEILLTPVWTFQPFKFSSFGYLEYSFCSPHFLCQGENMLVVTHKSILRALICTALGLPPERQVGPFLWLQFGVLCTLGLEKFVENITSCFTILPNLQDCKHFLFLLFFWNSNLIMQVSFHWCEQWWHVRLHCKQARRGYASSP